MKRRRNLFILLFVLALIVVSALVIANKPTKLGLDLKGGVQLVYQGTPDWPGEGSQRRRHRTLDRNHPPADRQAGRLRARSLPPRHHRDLGQPARRDQRAAGDRNGRDHRAAAVLRLGAEPDRPREGDRWPPGPRTAESGAGRSRRRMEGSRSQHQNAGSPAADLLRRLPERLRRGQARLRTGAGRRLHQLLDDQTALLPVRRRPRSHADRRPGVLQGRPLHQRDREEAPAQGDGDQGPGRDDRRIRTALRRKRRDDQGDRQGRLVRDQGQPGAVGHRNHQPGRESRRRRARRHLRIHRQGPRSLPGSHPQDRPARPGRGDRRLRRRRSRTALRPLRGRPRQRSQDAADHQLRPEPGRDRRPHRRPDLRRLHQHRRSAGNRDLPADRRPADQPEADQPDAGLGDARHPGAARGDQGRA